MNLKYSVLELACVRENGTIQESFHNGAELAQLAESLGYERFWLAEHHNIAGIACAATSVLIGYIAEQTKSIRVGSGGIMLPNHPPLIIAEQFGTLETLYPGRIDLGLGRAPGTDPKTAAALHRDPSAANTFPAQVQEILHYFYDAKPTDGIQAIPGTGLKVPVWLLGSSTYSAQLAAYMGLPFGFAGHFAPALAFEAFEIYKQNFRPSEFLEEPYTMLGISVITADSDEEADYLATSTYQVRMNLVRNKPLYIPPPVQDMSAIWMPHEEQIVREQLGLGAVGGPEKVERKLRDLALQTGVKEFIIQSVFYDQQDRLKSYRITAEAINRINGT